MTINVENIKPGDTVTLEHEDGSRLVREVATTTAGDKAILPLSPSRDHTIPLTWLLALGWSITDHKPKVVLPTEPGIYAVSPRVHPHERIIQLRNSEWIHLYRSASAFESDTCTAQWVAEIAAHEGRLTRLVPENENRAKIAAEVLDAIDDAMERRDWSTATVEVDSAWAEVRKRFGVES